MPFEFVYAQDNIFITKDGCKFHHFSFSPNTTNFQISESINNFTCVHGSIEGGAYYKSSGTVKLSDGRESNFEGIRAGIAKLGRFEGPIVSFSSSAVTKFALGDSMPGRFIKNSSNYSLQVVFQKSIEVVERSQLTNRDSSIEYLTLLIKKWDSDPNAFLRDPASIKVPAVNANTSDQTNASNAPSAAQQPQSNSNSAADETKTLTSDCNREYDKIREKYTDGLKAAMARGDIDALGRLGLVQGIGIRDLYSGRCAYASNGASRRATGQEQVDKYQNLCQKFGMGSQCAAPPIAAAPRPAPASSQSSSNSQSSSQNARTSGQTSGGSDGDSEIAGQCISITRIADRSAEMRNTCGYDIEARWCYVGADCKNGNWGVSSQSTIRAGATYPATTFASNSNQYSLYYIACRGRNTSPREVAANSYVCKK